MEFLFIAEQSILPLFVIIATAYAYTRAFRPDPRPFTNITLSIFAPVFVFDSLFAQGIQIASLLQPFLFMVLLTTSLLLISTGAALLLKLEKKERNSFALASSMMNVGNFGLPLIFFTYGPKAVAASVLYFVVFNIPLSTVAVYLSSDKPHFRDVIKDVLRIPILHAFLLALLLSHFRVELPEGIEKGLHLIAQGAIPLLIFILGMQLGSVSITYGLRPRLASIVTASVIRLALSPLLALLLLSFFSMSRLEHHVAVIQTSGPSAILPLMYAIKFNRSPDLLAGIILITTLASGITLPFLIRLLG